MRDMSAASSSDVDRHSLVGKVGRYLVLSSCEGAGVGFGWVKGVVGTGMLAAVSWRVSKSVERRPSGMNGGQRRWRLGVEGGIFSWSLDVSSEMDLRRFREERGGVCGCGIFLVAHCCGRDCFLEWTLVPESASAIGLAS